MSSAAAVPRYPTLHRHGRVVFSSMLGSLMELYDFAIYGLAAALVFSRLFFPSFSSVAGTLAAFATFGAGFVARPLGGIVFGHFGDRIGRKRMLQISFLTMASSTVLIGCLPTHAQIGLAAPLLLVLLRLLQGFSAGGEIGGALVMVLEHAPSNRRATLAAFVPAGMAVGGVVGSLAFLVLQSVLSPAQFLAWGWRLPFLLSVVLLGIGMYVRSRVDETPVFEKVAEAGVTAKAPVAVVLRDHWRTILRTIGILAAFFFAVFLQSVFSINYLTATVGVSRGIALSAYLISQVGLSITILFAGRFADRFGRRRVMVFGLTLLAVCVLAYFPLLDTGSTGMIYLGMILLGAACGIINGALGTFFAEIFPPRIRYSGFSMGYQFASVVGGFTPTILTAVIAASDGTTLPAALLIVVLIVISLGCLAFVPDGGGPRRRVLSPAPDAQEDSPLAGSHARDQNANSAQRNGT